MMRKGGRNLLAALRQSNPGLNAEQLRSRRIAGVRGALRMNDAAAGCHPIDFTRLDWLHCPEIIAVHDLAGKQVSDCCQTDMRVRTHLKGLALNQLQRSELVEENKRSHGSALRRWQCPHHVETADVPAAWYDHGIDRLVR